MFFIPFLLGGGCASRPHKSQRPKICSYYGNDKSFFPGLKSQYKELNEKCPDCDKKNTCEINKNYIKK